MSKLTTFKGDTLKASKDIVPQTIGWWGEGGGAQTYKLQVLQNLVILWGYILVSFQQIMFKLGILTKIKVFFKAVLTDFCFLVPVKRRNDRGRVYSN